MSDINKIDFNSEALISRSEDIPGGFFPIGENNFWHGGIHIFGDNNPSYITPIIDGEIIACRITNEYEMKQDELDNSYNKCEYDEALRSNENNTIKINNNELNIGSVIRNSLYSQVIDHNRLEYILKTDLADDHINVLKKVFHAYSNNFVLMRHKKCIAEKDVVFYSLYMHLLPWNYYPNNENEEKLVKPFYKEITFKITENDFVNGILTHNNILLPPGSYVEEELNDNNYDLIRDQMGEKVLNVRSRILDQSGYIPMDPYLEKISDRKIVIPKGTAIYYDEAFTARKGTINEDCPALLEADNSKLYNDIPQGNGKKLFFFDYTKMDMRALGTTRSFSVTNNNEPGFFNYTENVYILDCNSNQFKSHVYIAGRKYVTSQEGIILYDLDTAVVELVRYQETKRVIEAGYDEQMKAIIAERNKIEKNGNFLKLFFDDSFVFHEPSADVLKYYPNAKKVELKSTDCSYRDHNKGWVRLSDLKISKPAVYRVKEEPVSTNAERVSTNNEVNNKCFLVHNGSYIKSEVCHFLEKGKQFRLKNSVNDVAQLNHNGLVSIQHMNGEDIGFVKAKSVFNKTDKIIENIETVNINDNSEDVDVFEKPLPAFKDKTILGLPGKMGFQNNMFHLELFFKDDAILELNSDNDKKCYYFKKGEYTFTKRKEEWERTGLNEGVIIKKLDYESNDPDIINVESLELQNISIWIKFSDIEGKYSYSEVTEEYTFNCFIPEIKTYLIQNPENVESKAANEVNGVLAFITPGLTGKLEDEDNLAVKYSESKNIRNDDSYRKVILPVMNADTEKKRGYLNKKLLSGNFEVLNGDYYITENSDTQWMKSDPGDFQEDGNINIQLNNSKIFDETKLCVIEAGNVKWLGFVFDNNIGWIKEEDLNAKLDETKDMDMLEIMKHDNIILNAYNTQHFFRLLEETDSNKMKDGICDVQELLSNLGINMSNSGLTDTLKFGDVRRIQDEVVDAQSNLKVKEYLKRLTCKMPIEWENMDDNSKKRDFTKDRLKSAPYGPVNETEINRYFEMIKKLSWFTQLKYKINCDMDNDVSISANAIRNETNNILLFAHPVTMTQHLSMFSSSINPFKGHKILNETVIDNPGFAPLKKNENDIYNFSSYCSTSGLFNDDYSKFYNRKFYHEGVDFSSVVGCKIISFINGRVILSGQHIRTVDVDVNRGYGTIVVIQDLDLPNHYYLLGHLSESLVEKDQIISPGEVVAHTGETGAGSAHLHLSFIKCNNNDINKIYILQREGIYQTNNAGHKDKIYNPFNHKISWKNLEL